MDFVKKHKIKLIISFVIVTLIIIALVVIKGLIYPDSRKDHYGNRLEGIDKVNIESKRFTELSNKLKDVKGIKSIKGSISGRIINVIINVENDVDLITSQSYSEKVIENFSEEELKFYDFQIFVNNNDKENVLYPIIGYKHRTSSLFKWTK